MSVQHFKSLLFRSAQIQKEIDAERQRRWPDWMRLIKLKKLRLIISDRLQQLAAASVPAQMQLISVKAGRAVGPYRHHN